MTISAIVGTLAAGTYTGHITVTVTTSGGAIGSPGKITVTFIVAPLTPVLSLSTTSVSFNATQGGANPSTSSVNVTNTGGGGALGFTAGTDSSSTSWLSVTPSSGTTAGTLTISAKVGTLTAGTYTGSVTVTASGALNSPATISVTFNVAPPPALSLSTTTVSFNAFQGGVNPATTSISLTNIGGGGALGFTASTDSNSSAWLGATPSSGSTPGTLVISAKVGSLTAGTYTGYVTVTATGAGTQNSPAMITVTFNVSPPATLSLSKASLSFSAIQSTGADPTPASVSVSNTGGGGALAFTAASDSSWLSVSPSSSSTPDSLLISPLLGTLPVGTYNGNVTVTAAGAQGSPAAIAVTFVVSPILGDSNVEKIVDPGSSGQAQAIQATASATGSLNSLTVFLDSTSAASQIYVGIYADNNGHPGTLLGQGNLGQGGNSTLPSGWNSIAISTGNTSAPNVDVTVNTLYWIAMLGTQGGTPVYLEASTPTCTSENSSATDLKVLPAQWTGTAASACPASIYGMLTPVISGVVSGIPSSAGPTLVALSGAATGTTTPDASGNYAFSVLASKTYTVTPSNSNYTFSPASQTVNIISSSVSGVSFNALYSIFGNVGAGAGVNIYLSGAASASTTDDSLGNYNFGGLANGATYYITPSDVAYIFSPSVQTKTINGDNITGVNFTANNAPPGYSISGKITLSSKGLGGGSTVTLTLQSTGAIVTSTTADSAGSFTLTGIPNGAYVVTPSSQTAAFTPASLNVTINGASYTAANFTAAGLVFYDDFTGTSLSSAWTVISRHGEYDQNETECNIPQMVSVANGAVTITTEQTPNPDPLKLGTCGDFNIDGTVRHTPSSWPYITGDIQWTSLNFTYGTVEIRAKFPSSAAGLWPATWLLNSGCQATNIHTADTGYLTCPPNGTSPYTEIDMTECYGNSWCQFHIANPSFGIGNGCDAAYANAGHPVDTNYHIFTTVWTSTSVKQYMDGSLITTCNQNLNKPMFLIIQTQTGGSGGTPNNSNLPTQFSIDYVKVTQP